MEGMNLRTTIYYIRYGTNVLQPLVTADEVLVNTALINTNTQICNIM